jgi:hypothetical protein
LQAFALALGCRYAMRPRSFQTLALALLLIAGGTGVFAAEAGRLPEAVSRIERETGGRVLSAEKSQRGGREMNRIKVVTPEGRVRVMWDDPQRDRRDGARRGERGHRPAARDPIAERDREPVRDDG